MKLFKETILKYIASQVEEQLLDYSREGAAELRIFTQSMPPHAVYDVFNAINDYIVGRPEKIEHELKVAYGLYDHWLRSGDVNYSENAKRLTERYWVDLDDRLTHYRNIASSENSDLLLVVLVGIDHAADRGGLADFHVLTDDIIFRECLNGDFHGWAGWLLENAKLADADGSVAREFDNFFQKLFRIRPRNLYYLSEFLDSHLLDKAVSCEWASDALALAFESLPYWGIPPLFSPADPAKRIALLDEASKLFKHDSFRDTQKRKKALDQIEDARDSLAVAPQVVTQKPYASPDGFLDTLSQFVRLGSPEASERLLHTDFFPVIKILQTKRTKKRSKAEAPARLRGPAFQVFSEAVFKTSEAFAKNCGTEWGPSHLQEIQVFVERFEFDGGGESSLAADEVYRGLLGGIDNFLKDFEIDLCLEPDGDSAKTKQVPLSIQFGRDGSDVQIAPKNIKESRLLFRIVAQAGTDRFSVEKHYVWVVPPNHEERVRYTCARLMDSWFRESTSRKLPVIHLGSTLDELYFAVDAEEANRLLVSGIFEAEIRDGLAGFSEHELDVAMKGALDSLSSAYREFISALVHKGYFCAIEGPLIALIKTYNKAVDLALKRHEDSQPLGEELIRRLYQLFLCVPDGLSPVNGFVPAVVATGITPAIAEAVQAREVFLRDGLVETIRILLEEDVGTGKAAFDRLQGLVELRRPLYGLIYDTSLRLTTNLRPFGLIHRIGEKPEKAPTLAAQAEMRSDDLIEDESISSYLRATPESTVVLRTLRAYRQIHPFATDRISILGANVEDLRPIIAGVNAFIDEQTTAYSCDADFPFVATIQIIGRGPSAIGAQEILRRWQERWLEAEGPRRRLCRLSVSYRPARTREEVLSLLKSMEAEHDVGFLFDFLNDQSGGDSIVPAEAFEPDWKNLQVGKFPICEHPRLAGQTDSHLRQGLVSNRRFTVAAHHAEMTARVHNPYNPHGHHLIFNQVEYGSLEQNITRRMHSANRWVACIDRFVDKSLILDAGEEDPGRRKLVGFSSGVGAYGELNLTLSTESNTTGALVAGIAKRLAEIYQSWSSQNCKTVADKLVGEAQSVTGLSLVSALGNEGVLRDVIGYAIANRLYLDRRDSVVAATLPLDSFAHWFEGASERLRPDLLLLEATLSASGGLVIDATVIECKVGKMSPHHAEESITQAGAGLTHLSSLFLPIGTTKNSTNFDRRYWWAQLHRALVVRNELSVDPSQKSSVEHALELLAEGYFSINWRAVGATFWTDDIWADEESVQFRRTHSLGYLYPDAKEELLEVHHAAVGNEAVLKAMLNDSVNLKNQIWPLTAASLSGAKPNFPESAPTSILATEREPEELEAIYNKESHLESESLSTEAKIDLPAGPRSSSSYDKEEGLKSVEPNGIPTESEQEDRERYIVSKEVADRFFLGYELTSHGGVGESVYWEFGHDQLPNRHLLVFGTSGAGKTYAIQALLLEMAKAQQPSLVIDYTDGFKPDQLELELKATANPKTFAVFTGEKLPLDPFRVQSEQVEGFGHVTESSFDVAKRVASIFTAVYSTLGEQQRATLVDRVEQGVDSGSFSLEALFDQLREEGQDLLANKIMPLARTAPFSMQTGDAWKILFDGSESFVKILQLMRIDREVQRLIIEFVLWDLWDYLRRTGSKDKPMPVVLDEIQNLDHRSGSPLEKYLREGRKFGASMILATQTLSNFGRDERDRLFQAAHKLFFAPASTELRGFATILRDTVPNTTVDDWAKKLSSLKKGECLSAGYEMRSDGSLRPTVRRIAIASLSERVGG